MIEIITEHTVYDQSHLLLPRKDAVLLNQGGFAQIDKPRNGSVIFVAVAICRKSVDVIASKVAVPRKIDNDIRIVALSTFHRLTMRIPSGIRLVQLTDFRVLTQSRG